MTCIVGLKHNDKIYIGGDSLGSNTNFQKTVRVDEKVFVKDEMIFGFTSSFRMGQIIRYAFDIPARMEGVEDMEYLVRTFIPSLIECYKEHGFLPKDDEDHSVLGGIFLLGYKSQLYQIDTDFQVGIPSLDYDACGCGDDLALGSMFTSERLDKKLTPDKRITMALEAASAHSAGVSAPFVIKSV